MEEKLLWARCSGQKLPLETGVHEFLWVEVPGEMWRTEVALGNSARRDESADWGRKLLWLVSGEASAVRLRSCLVRSFSQTDWGSVW